MTDTTIETKKPASCARVTDVERSNAFYANVLGLRTESVGAELVIVEPAGWPLLLAGPTAVNLAPYLADAHEVVKPGATIHRFSTDIDTLARRIDEHGHQAMVQEAVWGDRTLTVSDPDGYPVCFWTTPNRTLEQTIALYASGPDALEAVLEGLAAEEMTWKPAPDDWSIREIVHHVADSDATAFFRVKMALAEPGRVMLGNPYHPDTWANGLDYQGRDIAPSLTLLRATRAHILQLINHLPDAMERTVKNPEGEATPVETFISMLASHLMIHIDQIRDVQKARTH
jgi:catechol 2,3-dioxygenase-like lactoylglutathione lyase family enzyme